MQARFFVGASLLCTVFAAWLLADTPVSNPAPATQGKHIADLIGRLGSTRFQDRNAAQKELEAIGPRRCRC